MKELFVEAAERAARYAAAIRERRVPSSSQAIARLASLGGAVPAGPSDPAEILALLDDVGSPATVATTGGRYFGFVIGGTLPAALCCKLARRCLGPERRAFRYVARSLQARGNCARLDS